MRSKSNSGTALRCLIGGAVLAAAFATSALASPYNGLYVFGDSLSDVGNAYFATGGAEPVSPPYSKGRFSNGPLWVQDLSGALGLGAVTPALNGGNDFAVGGAETGPTPVNAGGLTDLTSQFGLYSATVPAAHPDALYALWIGSNDVDSILSILGALGHTDVAADITAAMGNIATVVNGLAQDGMKNLLALNVPDLGVTPRARAAGPAAPAAPAIASAISAEFDQALQGELDQLALRDDFALGLANTYARVDQIVADPAGFGLTNVTSPCWTGNYTDPASGTLCSDSMAAQDQYLFWDGIHPTAAGHALVADAALAALPTSVPEPGSAGLLALGAVGLLLARRRLRRA